jgi:hypothetical protein
LGELKPPGRPGHLTLLGHRDEVAQLPEVDVVQRDKYRLYQPAVNVFDSA